MATELPVLMHNTKVNTYNPYVEDVFERNTRFFRKVYADEITPAMCKSACISYGPFKDNRAAREAAEAAKPEKKVTIKVKEEVPEKAPTIEVEPGKPERPDISGWKEDQMRVHCQENDIPTHPAARKAGLEAAITRYYNELDKAE